MSSSHCMTSYSIPSHAMPYPVTVFSPIPIFFALLCFLLFPLKRWIKFNQFSCKVRRVVVSTGEVIEESIKQEQIERPVTSVSR
jgi:hypothetical protein